MNLSSLLRFFPKRTKPEPAAPSWVEPSPYKFSIRYSECIKFFVEEIGGQVINDDLDVAFYLGFQELENWLADHFPDSKIFRDSIALQYCFNEACGEIERDLFVITIYIAEHRQAMLFQLTWQQHFST